MKEFLHRLFISIIGILFMAGFSQLFPQPSFWHYFSLLSFLLLLYYFIFPLLKLIWSKIKQLYKYYFPKVGILNGNIHSPKREYKCERVWSQVTASMWKYSLNQNSIKRSSLILTSQISNKYSIIINPFGDVFPEQDIKLHKTFYSLCDYMENGGIFVVSGGAFFLHQNTINSSKAERVITKIEDGLQSLNDSFLFYEFGIQTTGDEYNDKKECVSSEPKEIEIYQKSEDKYFTGNINLPKSIKRFRSAKSGTSNFIPLVREKSDKSFPVIAVQYGKGYLIHAGLSLESETSEEFKLIIRIIINLIIHRFKPLLQNRKIKT